MKPRYFVQSIPIYRIIGPTPGPAGLRHHLQRTRGYTAAQVRRVPLGVQREIWRRDVWWAFLAAQTAKPAAYEARIVEQFAEAQRRVMASLSRIVTNTR